jgi:hypothetical protein
MKTLGVTAPSNQLAKRSSRASESRTGTRCADDPAARGAFPSGRKISGRGLAAAQFCHSWALHIDAILEVEREVSHPPTAAE